jgi:parvulin-like peptidyl-prolyl isomerase
VLDRLLLIGFLAAAPAELARAEAPASPDAGTGGMWIFLKSTVPDAAKKCPDSQPAGQGAIKVPLFSDRSGECPVAVIEGGPAVTVDDLATGLAGAHRDHASATKASSQDPTAIVNRLVDAKLVVMEGEAMGVDELPEVKESLKATEETVAREMLKEQVLRGVKADPAEVRRLFEDKVREWQLQSVLFAREADALAMSKAVKAGKKFDELAAKAVTDKKAKGNEPGQFVHGSQLLPAVLGAVQKMKVGQVSAPVKVPGGYAVVEIEAVRYPENAKARGEAEATALLEARKKALKSFYDGLVKKYARIDEKLLKKLDFEAKKPGFEALKKDPRVIATVKGQSPVTVGLLTTALAEQFYHGVDNATQQKRLNNSKGTTLDALVSVRVVAAEVDAGGLKDTAEYKRRMDNAREGQIFGAFVRKVVLPDVKVDEAAVRKDYDAHRADYTVAAFYKVDSIGFARQKDAEAAVAKLRSGTDFKWLNANADGKLDAGKDAERPSGVISSKAMTPAFAKAMEGAKAGDYRVFAAPNDQFFAVQVLSVTPSTVQPFEEVREAIGKKLYGEAVQNSVQDWVGKLRKAHPVQMYLNKVGA